MDTSGRRHAGLLDGDDLAHWRATKEAPVARDYHGWRVHKAGVWSQGPVLLQQLALLEGFDLDALDPTDPAFVHTVTEAAKLAFADRELFYGDPAFVDVPLETLLSDAYAERRRALIGHEASRELRPGEIPGYGGDLARLLEIALAPPAEQALGAFGGGEPTVQDDKPQGDGSGHGDRQAPGDTGESHLADQGFRKAAIGIRMGDCEVRWRVPCPGSRRVLRICRIRGRAMRRGTIFWKC